MLEKAWKIVLLIGFLKLGNEWETSPLWGHCKINQILWQRVQLGNIFQITTMFETRTIKIPCLFWNWQKIKRHHIWIPLTMLDIPLSLSLSSTLNIQSSRHVSKPYKHRNWSMWKLAFLCFDSFDSVTGHLNLPLPQPNHRNSNCRKRHWGQRGALSRLSDFFVWQRLTNWLPSVNQRCSCIGTWMAKDSPDDPR